MKALLRIPVAGVMALLSLPCAVGAADASHRCAVEQDDARRLACYDNSFGKPVRAAERAGTVLEPAVVPAAPMQTPKPAKPTKAERKAAEPPPAKIESVVAALRELRDSRVEITLKNGEVWAQVEADMRVVPAVGDAVTIRPAMLGSFLLVMQSGATTRVKRVKALQP